MIRNKVICEKCGREISKSNLSKHLKSHETHPENFEKETYHLDHDDLFCKFCGKEYKNKNSLAQHEIRCVKNENRLNVIIKDFNNKGKSTWNKGLTKETDERIFDMSVNQSKVKKGCPGRPHTEEFKKRQRENALKNHLGGFHMRRGVYYNDIKLDSSYEVAVAKDLDDNGIKWERPGRFPYHDNNGVLHYYTPDFYLLDYDIYLDPKNDFLINNINPRLGYSDLEKIDLVKKENGIKIIVLNKEQLNWKTIKTMLP